MRTCAIIGSRTLKDISLVHSAIKQSQFEFDYILSGGAHGIDGLAIDYAKGERKQWRIIRPDYDKYEPQIAPKMRNKDIAKECDCMIAIWDGVSGGTANAISWAVFYDKPIHVKLVTK